MKGSQYSLLHQLHHSSYSQAKPTKPARLSSRASAAFTIVELLVVIVVIGILATITIVAYTGISQRAIVASIQSDLNSTSKQLNMFQVTNSAYPNSVTDCPTPVSTDICLKTSPGNTVSSYSANNSVNPQTYSLAIANGSNIYKVSNGTQPTQLASAPLSPVADWLATTQGDHYGNFYDLVTNSWATVTRSGAKTIYDPATQKIYDVPANKLAINPRSDGKSGSEALIEESRTNLLTHSYFDSGLTGWTNWGSPPTREVLSSGGIYGTGKVFHLVMNADNQGITQSTSTTSGTTYTLSDYVKIVSGQTEVMVYNNGNFNGYMTPTAWAGDGKWHRISVTYTATVTTSTDAIWLGGSTHGEYYADAVQLEAGAFATSYISTTTAAVTRNADVVSVPTTGWNADNFTAVAVANTPPSADSNDAMLLWWVSSSGDAQYLSNIWYGNYLASAIQESRSDGGYPWGSVGGVIPAGYHTSAGSLVSGGALKAYIDGSVGSPPGAASSYAMRSPNSTAEIGDWWEGEDVYNAPIQRVVVYSSALSDANVSAVTSAIQNGP